MRVQTLLMIVVALVFGLSAAILVSQFITSQPSPVAEEPEKMAVVVAARDIPLGEELTVDALELRDWPREMVPEGAFVSIDDVVGRRPAVRLVPQDVLLEGKLQSGDAEYDLFTQIPSGMHTFNVPTPDAAASGASLVRRGMRVDVLPIGGDETDDGLPLAQNVTVWTINDVVDPFKDESSELTHVQSVTLLLTREERARLQRYHGINSGKVKFSLRSKDDNSVVDVPEPEEIVEVPPEPTPAVAPRKRPVKIKTVRGLRVGSYEFTTDWVHASPPQ